jgi:hypothetical protein
LAAFYSGEDSSAVRTVLTVLTVLTDGEHETAGQDLSAWDEERRQCASCSWHGLVARTRATGALSTAFSTARQSRPGADFVRRDELRGRWRS